jgi:hypothetical protein
MSSHWTRPFEGNQQWVFMLKASDSPVIPSENAVCVEAKITKDIFRRDHNIRSGSELIFRAVMAPGANYMGGKRSAARARSKDSTGRVHKAYFGRQRLEILSKALCGPAPSGAGSSNANCARVSASDIAFSHARHPALEELHPDPTPAAPKLRNKSHNRSSSGSSRSSRVLEALDTTERRASVFFELALTIS